MLQNDANIQVPLFVKLQGNNGNPNALGATVRYTFDDGTTSVRWLTDGSGFQSSSAPQHFVVPIGKIITEIEVTWPDGEKQIMTEISEDSVIIQKGK